MAGFSRLGIDLLEDSAFARYIVRFAAEGC